MNLALFQRNQNEILWNASFCEKFWELDLFQFGVNPYVKFLEFPVGNTIFQPTLLQRVRRGSLAAEHEGASVSPSLF